MSAATAALDVVRARADTPGCAHVVHLNNAGASLLPEPVLAAVTGHLALEARIGGYEAAEQAQAAIARALAMEPEVVLFDEPTSSLDPELHEEVLQTMRELAREGMTMVVVTHEVHFAQDVADRVVFMAGGVVLEESPPAEFFANPRHDRARAFLRLVDRDPAAADAATNGVPPVTSERSAGGDQA